MLRGFAVQRLPARPEAEPCLLHCMSKIIKMMNKILVPQIQSREALANRTTTCCAYYLGHARAALSSVLRHT